MCYQTFRNRRAADVETEREPAAADASRTAPNRTDDGDARSTATAFDAVKGMIEGRTRSGRTGTA